MLTVVATGVLTVVLSLLTITLPAAMSRGIADIERKVYFLAAEVSLRLVLGSLLLVFANQTFHPLVIAGFGYVLVVAAVGLLVMEACRQRAYAVKSASFTSLFVLLV